MTHNCGLHYSNYVSSIFKIVQIIKSVCVSVSQSVSVSVSQSVSEFWDPLYISGTVEGRIFKFGKQIGH